MQLDFPDNANISLWLNTQSNINLIKFYLAELDPAIPGRWSMSVQMHKAVLAKSSLPFVGVIRINKTRWI
jgi:hypothetical protein